MGLTGCKRAGKGCPKRPFSAPEVRLPNDAIKHPEFCALFKKAHFWYFFGGPPPTKLGVAGCQKCPKRLYLAPEVWRPNHMALRPEYCAFHKAHIWLTFEDQLSTKVGIVLAAKSARKGRFRHPNTGCPITWLCAQNYFWLTFGGQLSTKVGDTGCYKSQERVPEQAVFGVRRQAAQSRSPAPNAPFVKRTPEA